MYCFAHARKRLVNDILHFTFLCQSYFRSENKPGMTSINHQVKRNWKRRNISPQLYERWKFQSMNRNGFESRAIVKYNVINKSSPRHQIYVTWLHSAITTEKENTRRDNGGRCGGKNSFKSSRGQNQFELKAEILLS